MRQAALVSALLLVALGCNRGPARPPAGTEYLKAIRFEGNEKLKSKTLVAGLALSRARRDARPPDPYLVQVDADRIRGEYLRKGFLSIDVRSRVERKGDAATVIYTVEEGERASTRVVINGVPDDLARQVRAALPLRDGAPFEYATYDLAKDSLIAVVEDAGYAHATLDATVYADRVNHEAIVQLDYTLGPECTFGDVEISGVDGDLEEAVRARLQFEPGQRYSTAAIAATQRALYGLGRFSTVQVQPAEESTQAASPVVAMKVAVAQSARREIRLGGGFGADPTAYEVRGRVGYTIAGWPFPLDTLNFDLRPAYARLRDGSGYQPRIRALASLQRQDLFWTYATGEVAAAYNYIAVEAYTSYGPRARLGFATPLKTQRLLLRLGWELERLDFREISPLIGEDLQTELGLNETQLNGMFNQSLVIDLRDHPIQPRLGAYAEVRVTEGTRFAGGAFDYFEIVPELRGYVPVGPVTLAGRVRAGAFYGADAKIPVTERFFSGGATNHRGFGERKLSPYVRGIVDDDDRVVPYGGTAMLETGIEARIPITTWRKMGISSAVFLDGGDVREEVAEIDLTNLHWAAGAGLRLNTLVGPVRADLAYRLNRTGPMEPAPGSRFAFHLTLGEAF